MNNKHTTQHHNSGREKTRREERKQFLAKISDVCREHGGAVSAGKGIVIVDTKKYKVTERKKK